MDEYMEADMKYMNRFDWHKVEDSMPRSNTPVICKLKNSVKFTVYTRESKGFDKVSEWCYIIYHGMIIDQSL